MNPSRLQGWKIPSPGERVAGRGRERNAGGNLKVSAACQTYSQGGLRTERIWKS